MIAGIRLNLLVTANFCGRDIGLGRHDIVQTHALLVSNVINLAISASHGVIETDVINLAIFACGVWKRRGSGEGFL